MSNKVTNKGQSLSSPANHDLPFHASENSSSCHEQAQAAGIAEENSGFLCGCENIHRDTFQTPNTLAQFSAPASFVNLGNWLYLFVLHLLTYKSGFLFPFYFPSGQDPSSLPAVPDRAGYSGQ